MKIEPVSPPSDKFAIAISVPLVFEYEDALKRLESSAITEQDIGDFIDFLCEIGYHQEIFRASREKFQAVLDKVPDAEPENYDRLWLWAGNCRTKA